MRGIWRYDLSGNCGRRKPVADGIAAARGGTEDRERTVKACGHQEDPVAAAHLSVEAEAVVQNL
jgi:hypothetical protein